MRRPHPSTPEDLAGPPSGPRERTIEPSAEDVRERTIEELYAEHWRYVLALLLGYGIPAQDAEDVAQAVWMNVHRRRSSYDAPTHKTPRAWIAGFALKCAANHRRTLRRRAQVLVQEDPDRLFAAVGLDPEQAAILRDLHRLIPNEDQRVALLLQVQHGLTVAEIAAVQEVTESAVEWRLHMARRDVKNGDDKRRGAYLGFGSLEALAEALEPKPIPDEVGRRQWERIAERIRQEEASPSAPETEPPAEPLPTEPPPAEPLPTEPPPAEPLPIEPPPSSFPPAAALPALASPTVPALVTLGTAKLAALLFVAFVSGAGAGVAGVLAWQAHAAGRHGRVMPTMDTAPLASAPTAPSSTAATSAAPSISSTAAPGSTTPAAPSTRPAVPATATSAAPSTHPSAPSSTAATSAAPSGAAPNDGASHRLLSRMREAMSGRHFSRVVALAEQHARQFGTTHIREREALRIQALRETGRTQDAEQHARAVITTHPEHRRAMERAAGRALP